MATLDHPPTNTRTDWDRLDKQTDDDIARAVATDPDSAPIPTADEMKLFVPAPARKPR